MGVLLILCLVPLIGSALVAFLPSDTPARSKQITLLVSAVTFVVAIVACLQFQTTATDFQLVERYSWIPSLGINVALGVDGLGLVMVFLTTLLVPLVVLAGWNDVEDTEALGSGDQRGATSPVGASRVSGASNTPEPSRGVRGYFALMLLLEAMVLGIFTALDVFFFYFLFEAILIPVYFMIGRYGTGRRTYAAVKFLIYSLAGGLVMLAALAMLWYVSLRQFGTPNLYLPDLMSITIDPALQTWLFWGFFIAFAIKAPLWPVHTWLPDAAGSATPGTAILLIGVLDKIGTFGMLRFCLPLFPDAAQTFAPVVIAISVIGIFYGALAAIGQTDMKRLFGYISLSHFGFMTLGIFVFTSPGQVGSAFYMLGHGISTALLFMIAGYLIARRRSANVEDYSGVVNVAPVTAGLFLVAGLTALALPGMSTFVSEILVLIGAFARYPWIAALATIGIILAALYVLLLYQRTMTGPKTEQVSGMTDLNLREKLAVAPLIAIVIFLGFYPAPVLNVLNPFVATTMRESGATDPQPTVPVADQGVQP